MSTKDAILGHVCVERGWMSEPLFEAVVHPTIIARP